jgi:PAS domain S-box-containing protein
MLGVAEKVEGYLIAYQKSIHIPIMMTLELYAYFLIILGTIILILMILIIQRKTIILDNERKWFKSITDSLGEGLYVMDSNAKINYINPSACKILGYKEDEILGKNAHNLFHSHYLNNNMKQADCPIFCGVMQNKSFISNKEYFLNSEGKNIPVALNSKLVLSAKNNLEIVSSFSDISVQKKLEDKSNLLIKALESSINCIVITNKDAYVEWANPAFEKLTGFKISEIIGKNPKEFISSRKQTKEFYSQMWKTILDKKPWRGELINKKKDGSLYDEELIITPVLDEKGEIVNFIAIKQDITYRKIIALEKEEKDKIFFQQSKMAAMGEMLGNIAHQWRQPLSSISTAATGMKLQKELDCLTDDDFNYAMDLINNSAQYLSQTIDDFRGFFDPKNNKEKEFLISNVIDKALSIVSSQFVAKDIEIIKNIEDISIVSLENELIQVFLNILNNSKDILLKLEGEKRLIFINAYMENKEIIIEIKDNAKGINEEIIDRIFEPYFTTKHQSQGTGIGLYMCQNIIKNHLNGTLSVCNEDYMYKNILYRGAKFTIRI